MSSRGDGLAPGAKIGRYVCLRRLAYGGMAELYLARLDLAQRFEKFFVVKRVLPHLSADPEFVTMFLREAQLASTLDHGGIAAVVDFGTHEGEHYLVMEYLHGRDVRALLRKGSKDGPLPMAPSLTIVRDVANALHYAHERRTPAGEELGLVHRDVSPANIMVTYEGAVKLLDFGIAKATSQTRATRTGTIKGKVGYMSPEQCATKPVDRRSDVFALSVVLYELTTGRRAFAADNEFAVMNLVARAEITPPQQWVDGYPPALAAIVAKGLAADPGDRHPTARRLAEAIEGYATKAGLSLSTAATADYLRSLFPEPPHPRMEDDLRRIGIEPPTLPSTMSLRARSYIPSFQRRSTRLRIGGALVVGLGLGLTPYLLRRDEAPEPEPLPAARRVEAEVAATPAATEPPTPVRAHSPTPPSMPAPETDPTDPPSSDAAPSSSSKKKKKRRRGKRKKKSAADPSVVDGFRPPSQRGR